MAIVDVEIPTGYVYTGYRFLNDFVRCSFNDIILGHACVYVITRSQLATLHACRYNITSQSVIDGQGSANIVGSLLYAYVVHRSWGVSNYKYLLQKTKLG